MRTAKVAPLRAAVDIAILNIGDLLSDRARAEIAAQQRLGANQLRPLHELVGLERIPRTLQDRRPVILRADAVEPVVAGPGYRMIGTASALASASGDFGS